MAENPMLAIGEGLRKSGRGNSEHIVLYPGVELFFIYYSDKFYHFQHEELPGMLQINYCLEGRMGWEMNEGAFVYLGAGDVSIHTMDCCAASQMTLPLGFYRGISISVEIQQFAEKLPYPVRKTGISAEKILENLCPDKKPFCMAANPDINGIFTVPAGLSGSRQKVYYQLKVQELFLYLESIEPENVKILYPCRAEQVELIKEIHGFLIHNLEKRYTIEELSRKYLINTSSLKKTFKSIYGQPIASYMKEYRIRRASELLRGTDDSIAVIAQRLGYENQGKFTQAFKDLIHMKPSEYRKQSQRAYI